MRALESATNLTRRLLVFGRKAQLTLKRIDPNDLVRSTMSLLKRLVSDRVSLSTDLTDTACEVLADPVELERALVNLVANARDVMPHGGRVIISTRVTRTSGTTMVELSVLDGGPGVREEDRPHLFEPFFTPRQDRGGTGLGLATVLGTAEQHGGTVHVSSGPDGRGPSSPLRSRPRNQESPRKQGKGAPLPSRQNTDLSICSSSTTIGPLRTWCAACSWLVAMSYI